MSRGRHLISVALCVLAGFVFLAWLVPALCGVQPWVLPGIQLGTWANLRVTAWLLVSAALLHPLREAWVVPLENSLEGRGRWVFPVSLSLFAVAYKVTQHIGFGTGAYDLSMYHYAVRFAWTEGPTFMWAYGLGHNFLAEHFSPLLLAFVPFDMVFRSPLVLLVGEGLIFGLGALTIAGAVGALGLRPLLAQCVAAAYATNANCWDALSFDFHPEALLPALLFATIWALRVKRAGWLAVSLLAVLSIKEDVAITLLPMVALVWVDERRSWRWPLAVGVLTLCWLALAVGVAMPLARPPGVPWTMFAERYGQWGATPSAAVLSMLSRPGEVVTLLFGTSVDTELRQLVYVPVLDPVGMLASVPAILEQRLSSFDAQQDLTLYYGVGIVAVWLLALARSARWTDRRFGLAAGLILTAAPMLYHPNSRVLTITTWQDLEDHRLLREHIPEGARVLAQTSVVPHLPVSTNVDLFPGRAVDFVALRPGAYRWPASDAEYVASVLRILDEEDCGVVARTPTLVILRKGAPRSENDAVKAMLPKLE